MGEALEEAECTRPPTAVLSSAVMRGVEDVSGKNKSELMCRRLNTRPVETSFRHVATKEPTMKNQRQ
jgi:hypothetical protein